MIAHIEYPIQINNDINDTCLKIGEIEYCRRVRNIVKMIMTTSNFKGVQLDLIKNELLSNGFVWENLKKHTRDLFEKVFLTPHGLKFLQDSIGKSSPSLYISGPVPEHIDKEKPGTYGLIMPIIGSNAFNFSVAGTAQKMTDGSVYIFDHLKPHKLTPIEYDGWVKHGLNPYVAIVGSVELVKY